MVLEDVKSIMKLSKRESTIDAIKEDFVKTNESFTQVTPTELLKIYLKTYHNAFKAQAELRAEFVENLMLEFGMGLPQFLEAFNDVFFDFTKEDSPFIKKTTAMIISLAVNKFGLNLDQLVHKFEGDEFTKEDQSWWYRDMYDELTKLGTVDEAKIEAAKAEAKKFK